MLLMIWGGLGAAFVLYVMIASAVQSGDRPGAGANAELSVPMHDPTLLVGDMSKFAYAFTPRTAPTVVFNVDGAPGMPADETAGRRLSDYRGKTILVNFWATWCAPCKQELPTLDALQKARGGADFEVVAVAADPKGRNAATKAFETIGVEHLDLLMDQRLDLAIAVGGQAALPLSILYDPAGNEVGRIVGEADWNSEEARALIERVIENG